MDKLRLRNWRCMCLIWKWKGSGALPLIEEDTTTQLVRLYLPQWLVAKDNCKNPPGHTQLFVEVTQLHSMRTGCRTRRVEAQMWSGHQPFQFSPLHDLWTSIGDNTSPSRFRSTAKPCPFHKWSKSSELHTLLCLIVARQDWCSFLKCRLWDLPNLVGIMLFC